MMISRQHLSVAAVPFVPPSFAMAKTASAPAAPPTSLLHRTDLGDARRCPSTTMRVSFCADSTRISPRHRLEDNDTMSLKEFLEDVDSVAAADVVDGPSRFSPVGRRTVLYSGTNAAVAAAEPTSPTSLAKTSSGLVLQTPASRFPTPDVHSSASFGHLHFLAGVAVVPSLMMEDDEAGCGPPLPPPFSYDGLESQRVAHRTRQVPPHRLPVMSPVKLSSSLSGEGWGPSPWLRRQVGGSSLTLSPPPRPTAATTSRTAVLAAANKPRPSLDYLREGHRPRRREVPSGGIANPATRHKHWTADEDETLRLAMADLKHNKAKADWKRIAFEYFQDTRSSAQCKTRWKNHVQPGVVRGNWGPHEDRIIYRMVEEGHQWVEIAKVLPGRLGESVRDRYVNALDPSLKKTPWTPEEDEILFENQRLIGNKWAEIGRLLPGRSENSIKNRYHNRQSTERRKKKGGGGGVVQKLRTAEVLRIQKHLQTMEKEQHHQPPTTEEGPDDRPAPSNMEAHVEPPVTTDETMAVVEV